MVLSKLLQMAEVEASQFFIFVGHEQGQQDGCTQCVHLYLWYDNYVIPAYVYRKDAFTSDSGTTFCLREQAATDMIKYKPQQDLNVI